MKLPNRQQAIIPEAKITQYLLSSSHPLGRHKAEFFRHFGFTAESWLVLANALSAHAAQCDVSRVNDNGFGTLYTIEGVMTTLDGRAPIVRVVWFVKNGEDTPRLATAYPL